MAGEAGRIEPGVSGGLFDQPDHRLVGQSRSHDLAAFADGAEQLPVVGPAWAANDGDVGCPLTVTQPVG
jgi:hypothetical protein